MVERVKGLGVMIFCFILRWVIWRGDMNGTGGRGGF